MTAKFKKLLMGIAALAALAAGGAAFANAQNGATSNTPAAAASETGTASDPADKAEPGEKADGTKEAGEDADGEHADDPSENVNSADTAKATSAALSAVPGGKVTDLSAERQDDNGAADKPEPGDTPDPSYESKIAYDVEVTKADGSAVDVHLDKAFKVLGTDKADHGGSDEGADGENANE